MQALLLIAMAFSKSAGASTPKNVLWLPLGDSITWGCTGPTIQDCHGFGHGHNTIQVRRVTYYQQYSYFLRVFKYSQLVFNLDHLQIGGSGYRIPLALVRCLSLHAVVAQ